MGDITCLRIVGEKQGDASSGCGTYASVGNHWQVSHEDEIFALALANAITSTDKGVNLQGLQLCKLIDKSSPLLPDAIDQNERSSTRIDLYHINKSGRWERHYCIQLRNALLTAVHVNISDNNPPTKCVSVNYDYILYKHLIVNTEFDRLAFPAGYNSLFILPKNPPASSLNPEPLSVVNLSLSSPAVKPVYAKSCLKEKGCTDAGTAEEPTENFEQVAILALPVVDDCRGYHHPEANDVGQPAEVQTMLSFPGSVLAAQIWGKWSLSGIFSVVCDSYIDALASVSYIPPVGEGSARMSGRDEFWYEEELRQKAFVGSTATTRARFSWGTDIHSKPQVYGVHTGEGTPYKNVRVANMLWNEERQRYEFIPAHDVNGPLITWTPENPEHGNVPGHTGNDRPSLDQPTILVTPIPDGADTYTTPSFPVPDPKEFNDYTLVSPAGSGIKPIHVYLKKNPRKLPDVVTRRGILLLPGTRWLDMSVSNNGNGAPIPAYIADKLREREFKAFDELRETLWLEMSKDPVLLAQFIKGSQNNVSQGYSPYAPEEGYYYGPNEIVKKFQVHHVAAIEHGGGVYDIDNFKIVMPRLHNEIHYRR